MIANIRILRPDRIRFYSNSGEVDRQLYIKKGDVIIEAGLEDTRGIINSFADQVDINVIMKRVAQGEYDLLTRRQGIFLDTTVIPTTLSEIKKTIDYQKGLYNSLPEEIKSSLGSFDKFYKMSDSKYDEFINSLVKPVESVVESEVSE